MKIIDCSDQPDPQKSTGALSHTFGRMSKMLSKESKVQDNLPDIFNRVLDQKFYLLCNSRLPGTNVTVPYILVGPPGVWAIYASQARGIFRAQDNTWEELDESTRHYKPGKPNLLAITASITDTIKQVLSSHGVNPPSVDPVLFFADQGVLVDSVRPSVRILLSDALERFSVNLALNQAVLDSTTTQKIINILTRTETEPAQQPVVSEIHDAFSFQEPSNKKSLTLPSINVPIPDQEPLFARKIPFNRRQWFILGALILLNFIILGALVLIVLYFAV
jgi:hypothetical protein